MVRTCVRERERERERKREREREREREKATDNQTKLTTANTSVLKYALEIPSWGNYKPHVQLKTDLVVNNNELGVLGSTSSGHF